MEKLSSRRADELESVFAAALSVIRAALVADYRLTEHEARGAEEDLRIWFQRLARRGATETTPTKVLRLSLLSAACQYGRSFQLWKLGGGQSTDAALNAVLSKEPDEVATDLDRRFDGERS